MAYTADGAIVLVPQRAILDASSATVVLTLAAPGGEMIGKIIAAIASDVSNTASITYEDAEGTKTHTFTEAGECVWFYGSTIDAWMKMDEPSITLGTYGDGRDGDATISTNTSLSENKFYENLTINSSIEVEAPNVVICVKDTLTMNADSYFRAYPDDAAEGAAGGAGASALSEHWYGASAAGGNGGFDKGSGTAGGDVTSALGGSGGAGGDTVGALGGAAGSATPPTYLPYFLEAILNGQDRDTSSFTGGAGGGGGASESTTNYGGGGGAGGGILCIVAKTMILDTTGSGDRFNARGGNGANAGSGQTDCAGGGAGGGGFVCVIYQQAFDENGIELTEAEIQALISVSDGERGLGDGTGNPGAPGSSGNSLILKHG